MALRDVSLVCVLLISCSSDQPARHVLPVDRLFRIEISIVPDSPSFNGLGSFWGEAVYCTITPELNALHTSGGGDALVIRFPEYYDGYVQKPGTFDLGNAENRDHLRCRQSVEVIQDVSGDHIQVRNFQVSGTMVLDSINAQTGESAGRLTDVVFREIAETGYYQWGGYTAYDTCLHLTSGEWNTFASVSRPCEEYGPPNCKLQVCDPSTGLSIKAPCTAGDQRCPNGDSCIIQNANYGTGACYTACTPFSASCGQGYECVQTSYRSERGICKRAGTGKQGQYCSGSDLSTTCEPSNACVGLVPYWEYQTACYRQCDYWHGAPGCDSNHVCTLRFYSGEDLKSYCYRGRCLQGGVCIPKEWVDKTAINQKSTFAEGYPCAWNGSRVEGITVMENGQVICRRICLKDSSGCPPGTTCDSLVLYREWGASSVPVVIGVCR